MIATGKEAEQIMFDDAIGAFLMNVADLCLEQKMFLETGL